MSSETLTYETKVAALEASSIPEDKLRALILRGAYDMGFHGLNSSPDAMACLASLVVNASKLGDAVDRASLAEMSARLTVLEQENAELREDRDLLRIQAGHCINRLNETATDEQVEHAKGFWDSGTDLGAAFDELRRRARITFTDNGFTLDADARSA